MKLPKYLLIALTHSAIYYILTYLYSFELAVCVGIGSIMATLTDGKIKQW